MCKAWCFGASFFVVLNVVFFQYGKIKSGYWDEFGIVCVVVVNKRDSLSTSGAKRGQKRGFVAFCFFTPDIDHTCQSQQSCCTGGTINYKFCGGYGGCCGFY